MQHNFCEIQDIIGGSSCFAIHNSKNLVAYEAGCSIILWDLNSDKKFKLHSHDSKIMQICFLSHDDHQIASVNGGSNPTLFITEWETLRRIKEIPLPINNLKEKSPKLHVKMSYSYYTNILGIIENQSDTEVSNNSGYILIFYEVKNDSVNQIFSSQLEHSIF